MQKDSHTIINKENWSKESKSSYCYTGSSEHYKDIGYTCVKCRRRAVYTAEDQKYTFEVKKRYIWQRRKYCIRCFYTLEQLRNKNKTYEQQWLIDKNRLQNDKQFLNEWLTILKQASDYRVRWHNDGMAIHLKKHLSKFEPS